MTEITQADRDAASAAQWDAVVRVGSLAEAFARHRLAERPKIVARLRDRMTELTDAIQKEWGVGSPQHYIGRDFMDLLGKFEKETSETFTHPDNV